MNKSKKMLLGMAITALVTLTAAVGLTYSYLVDVETVDNVITIGNVSLLLDEGEYQDTDIVSESKVPKAPKVTNNGTNDEYVFIKVMVPKKKVTLLYETDTDNHKTGEIIAADGNPSLEELFKMQTTSGGTDLNIDGTVFSYHKGTDLDYGWYYLGDDTNSDEHDIFYFGYNKRLAPGEITNTLFDTIQLKSFIDEEIPEKERVVKLNVFAYGIQAENLGLELTGDNSYLTEEDVGKIYEVVGRKQVM